MTSTLPHVTDLLEAVYVRHGAAELADTIREAADLARKHGMGDVGVTGYLSLADCAERLHPLSGVESALVARAAA